MVLAQCPQAMGASEALLNERERAAREVADFLWLPQHYAPDAPAAILSVFMNCVGVAMVRRVFGPPRIKGEGAGRVVTDFGWLAEAVVMTCFGRIPELGEIVRAVETEPFVRASAA